MVFSTDKDWSEWGRVDPYFAVLTDPRYRKDRLEENRTEFMQTGDDYVTKHLIEIERALGTIRRGRALDFGCGVGRIAIPLARKFDEVVGLDISTAMLEEAERNRANLHNVSFCLSDEQLTNAGGAFDFVHSYIVLQHIPVERGMRIAERLLEKVAIGGVASLHFSIGLKASASHGGIHWLRANVPGVHQVINLLRNRPFSEPRMQMNKYSLEAMIEKLGRKGFGKAIVGLEDHNPFLTAQIMARRLA